MLGLRRFVNSGNLPQIALARAERPRSHPRSRRPPNVRRLVYPQRRADRADRRTPSESAREAASRAEGRLHARWRQPAL